MEMTNIYIYGTIGALLCLIVGAMLGYARYEYQQTHANALQREHLEAVDAKWRELLTNAKLEASGYESSWKYADKYRHALVQAMTDLGIWNFAKHGDDPNIMIGMLSYLVAERAIDPAINQKAKNLHTAGVRKGAKRGRAQMQKLMQKSIDNQAAVIQSHANYAQDQAASIDELNRALFESQGKRQIWKDAVINTLNDKVALPGVRKSIREAINVECERLRLVAIKQGA